MLFLIVTQIITVRIIELSIANDPEGAEDRDTVIVNIIPEIHQLYLLDTLVIDENDQYG